MKGVCLRLYTEENKQHLGVLLYEWILEEAKKFKIQGVSVFRGIAGFGRHGVIHEEKFFELGSNVPIEIMSILTAELAHKFLIHLKKENINIVYTIHEIELGFLHQVDKY